MTTEDEEVLNMLAQKKPALEQAIGALKYVSRDEQMRADAEAREWFLMDQRVAVRANAINEVRIKEQAKLLEEAEIERTKQAQLIAEIEKVNARIEREKQEQFSQLIKAEKERQEKADQLARAEEVIAKAEKERRQEAERFAQLYERIAELERLQSIRSAWDTTSG